MVLSGNKSLPEPLLSQIYVPISYDMSMLILTKIFKKCCNRQWISTASCTKIIFYVFSLIVILIIGSAVIYARISQDSFLILEHKVSFGFVPYSIKRTNLQKSSTGKSAHDSPTVLSAKHSATKWQSHRLSPFGAIPLNVDAKLVCKYIFFFIE